MPKNCIAGISQWNSAGLRAGWWGVRVRQGLGILLFTSRFRPSLEPTQPPNQWVTGALSLGVKQRGREADHSPPSSAEVRNAWSYTSTPPKRLDGVMHSWKKESTVTPLPYCMQSETTTLQNPNLKQTKGVTGTKGSFEVRSMDLEAFFTYSTEMWHERKITPYFLLHI
jgi:hypothetical protein